MNCPQDVTELLAGVDQVCVVDAEGHGQGSIDVPKKIHVGTSASLTLKEQRWGPQVVWRRTTVVRVNSIGMLTVRCRRSRTRPRIMLVGATNSP